MDGIQRADLIFSGIPARLSAQCSRIVLKHKNYSYQNTLRFFSFFSASSVLHMRSTTCSFVPPWNGMLSPLSLNPRHPPLCQLTVPSVKNRITLFRLTQPEIQSDFDPSSARVEGSVDSAFGIESWCLAALQPRVHQHRWLGYGRNGKTLSHEDRFFCIPETR
jgi:hypothetical protein